MLRSSLILVACFLSCGAAMAESQPPPQLRGLLVRLQDPDPQIRMETPRLFAELGPRAADAVPELVGLIRSHVRERGWEHQFVRTHDPIGVSPFFATDALIHVGAPAVPLVIPLLEDPDDKVW